MQRVSSSEMMQARIGWLALPTADRAIAFVDTLSRTQSPRLLDIARNIRMTSSHASAKKALNAAIVTSGRTAEAWSLRDAVQTALYSLYKHAPPTIAGARAAAEAYGHACDAALALLLKDVLPPEHVATLYEPFATL